MNLSFESFRVLPVVRLTVAALLLCLGTATVHSADFRMLVTESLPGMEAFEFLGNDGQVKKIYLSTTHISSEYPIPSGGRVDLYHKYPEPEEKATPALSLQFPEGAKDTIVLLLAQGSGTDKHYRPIYIDDSGTHFPSGSILIYNFLNKPLMAKLGEEVVSVQSGKREIVELAKMEDAPFNGGVKFATEFNGEGQVFSSSSWYLLPTMKFFCLVYSDADGVPHVRRIRMRG